MRKPKDLGHIFQLFKGDHGSYRLGVRLELLLFLGLCPVELWEKMSDNYCFAVTIVMI